MHNKLFLVVIIILSAFIRLINLGDFPNGFTGDEAQQGYAAYSIAQTGKDEWGQFLTIHPRGFGDFKPPLYMYLTVPSVALFGLSIESTRIPAALMGVITVWVVYHLGMAIFRNKLVGLFSAFILAISPWHIQLSRTAFEGGAGIMLFSVGLLLFIKSLEYNKHLVLSVISFSLTIYTYHSYRIFTPLLLFLMLVIFRKQLGIRKIIISLIIFLLFALPLITSSKALTARFSDVGIYSKQSLESYFKDRRPTPLPPLINKLFDNKFLYIKERFYENYLSYFSMNYYFSGARSDSTYLNFPGFGLLYPIEIITVFLGVFYVVYKKIYWRLLLLWFLLSPVAASLADGAGNANRAINLLPLNALVSGVGIYAAYLKLREIGNNRVIFILIIPFLISFLFFLHFYFVKLPQRPIENLRVGYRQVFERILELEAKHDLIIISKAFTEPQIFVAFYKPYDPTQFQQASKDWLRYEAANKKYVDQLQSWNLDKFLFEDLDWKNKESQRKNALIVGKSHDFPENIDAAFEYRDPKGQVIYKIISTAYPGR